MRQIDYQYGSTITPFICVSAIYGYAVLQKFLIRFKSKKNQQIITFGPALLLIVSVASTVFLWGQLPVGKSSWFWFFIRPLPEKALMDETIKKIDSSRSVSVTNNIGAHFSQRQYFYNYPINAQKADYTVIYLGDPYAWPSGDEQDSVLSEMKSDPNYEIIASQGDFYAFKRKNL